MVITCVVYRLVNTINGKSYIGVTNSLERRISAHRKANGSCPYLHGAIRKYSFDSFEIEILYESWDIRHTWEIVEPELIASYDTFKSGYNMTLGGDGGKGYRHTEEHKKYMSALKTGKKRPPQTEEHKKKLSLATKGRKKTPEQIKAMVSGKLKANRKRREELSNTKSATST